MTMIEARTVNEDPRMIEARTVNEDPRMIEEETSPFPIETLYYFSRDRKEKRLAAILVYRTRGDQSEPIARVVPAYNLFGMLTFRAEYRFLSDVAVRSFVSSEEAVGWIIERARNIPACFPIFN